MIPLLTLALLAFQAVAQTNALPPTQDEPLTLPAIVYPAEAKAAHITGTVHLVVEVDPTGRVTHVRALDGPAPLQQAAIDAYSRASYRPLLKVGIPTPAEIATAVNFTLTDAPPTTDQEVSTLFQPAHAECQQQSAAHAPDALDTCRKAVALSQHFTQHTELAARVSAYNDLVLLLIAAGKKSPNLPESAQLADQAVALVADSPATAATAVAHITRAEVRSLGGDLPGAAADCATAEDILSTLLADQGKRTNALDQTETERAGNYRVQLRETLQLHAVILDRQHKSREAKALRTRADTL